MAALSQYASSCVRLSFMTTEKRVEDEEEHGRKRNTRKKNEERDQATQAPPRSLWPMQGPARLCLCVGESARFTRVTTVEAAGAVNCFPRLRRAASLLATHRDELATCLEGVTA
ncbi:unnamed protein product [Pleuronectes platessa]|uniref:Uncharacterized protein n=1 Tax=Pleuronectes platessa TaxID=8262 RepID=A0A9N7U125_PLEPL|nr:unnamed protein product [Pleuronectes platessa]